MILRSLTSQGKSTPEFRLAVIAVVVFLGEGVLGIFFDGSYMYTVYS